MTFPTEKDVRVRIDEIEARLNGLCMYLAAKEAGLGPDISDQTFRQFISATPLRPSNGLLCREEGPGPGYGEVNTIFLIGDLARKLRDLKSDPE